MGMIWDAASRRQVWKAEQPINARKSIPMDELRTARELAGLAGVHEMWNVNGQRRKPYDLRGATSRPKFDENFRVRIFWGYWVEL
jgi:hypothetical protein